MKTSYMNSVLSIAEAVLMEQNKPREAGENPVYTYVTKQWNKVPSIPLEDGERYFSVHTEEEFKKVWGRMRKRDIRRNAMSLFPIVQYFRQFAEKDNFSIVIIPCHSSKWTADFASPREDGVTVPANPNTVRRAVRMAVRVGLLAVYEQGSFRRSMEGMGLCTKYLYNKKVEKWITAKFREFGITKADFHRVTRSATKARVRREMSDAEVVSKVRIGRGLNLPNLHDETVYRALYRNYPMLRELGDGESGDVRACNKMAEKNGGAEIGKMARITSTIRIKRGKGGRITGIAFRPWSNAGIMKSEDRRAELNRMAKTCRKVLEFDVKASIYQVTELCNRGVWRGNSYDEYRAMAGFQMDGKQRSIYKHGLAMRLYFAESDKSCMSHILALGRDAEDICSRVDGWRVVQEARARMFAAIGPGYGSEIFLHEACIYVRALRKLLEKGEKALLVYDCFYLLDSRLSSYDVAKVVRECAEEYYRTWFADRGARGAAA